MAIVQEHSWLPSTWQGPTRQFHKTVDRSFRTSDPRSFSCTYYFPRTIPGNSANPLSSHKSARSQLPFSCQLSGFSYRAPLPYHSPASHVRLGHRHQGVVHCLWILPGLWLPDCLGCLQDHRQESEPFAEFVRVDGMGRAVGQPFHCCLGMAFPRRSTSTNVRLFRLPLLALN